MSSFSTPLVWRGVLGIITGVIALVWPDITVGAFVILFAIYAFAAAITEFARAFRGTRAGPVVGRLLIGAVDVAAGIIAIAWPNITALALVWLVAGWAAATGILQLIEAFRSGETPGERAILILTGALSILLGFAFAARPDVGAITIAEVYGFFSVATGVTALVLAYRGKKALHTIGLTA